ncbi:MAG: TAXI family TRAP transporter solute-binding subunit [Burkholderiales bacterium]
MRTGSDGAIGGLRFALVAAAFALHTVPLDAVAQVKILTGVDAYDVSIGEDLATLIAEPVDMRLDVLPSPSSPETLGRLRSDPGVNLAAVQSDVFEAFVAQDVRARSRRPDSTSPPPRVVLRLPEKEVHFLARADAPFEYVHQIRDARINVGTQGGSTATTTEAIYRLLFGKTLARNQTSYLPHEEALVKLVTDGTIDVVAIAAAQPAPLLAKMTPEARQYVKVLRLDADRLPSPAVTRAYPVATLRASSYPALLTKDQPTLAVEMYIVTLDYRDHVTETRLIQFGRSLCRNFSALRTKGQPKWREVEPLLTPLPNGWNYYPPTRDELRNCKRGSARG